MRSELDSFFRKGVFCSLCSCGIANVVSDTANIFTSIDLSCKDVIIFSKSLSVFDIVYVKSNSIMLIFCLKVSATL